MPVLRPIFIMTPAIFQIAPVTAPGKSAAEVKAMLDLFAKKLKELGITFTRNVTKQLFLPISANSFVFALW